MHKAERDTMMTRLNQVEREQFRRLIQDVRTRATGLLPPTPRR